MVTRLTDYTKQFWILLSTDDMDTLGAHNGDEAIVIDRNERYVFDEENQTWHQIPMSGGGGGGKDPLEIARSILDGTVVEYVDPVVTVLKEHAFRDCPRLSTLRVHGVVTIDMRAIQGTTSLGSLAFPNLNTAGHYALASTSAPVIDFGESYNAGISSYVMQNAATSTLVFRHNGVVPLDHIPSLPTPFQSNGSGGTLYVPSALIASYQSASNWSTILGYPNNQIKAIEGSVYETQYADGTPIA